LSARERLEQYLHEVRQRLRAAVVARASAVVALTALLVTLVAVWLLRDPGFPPEAVLGARIALFAGLAVAAAAMLWRPLLALRPHNQSRAFERHLPTQGGRIETYMELARRQSQGQPAPLIDLLAEDALAVAEQAPPPTAVPGKRTWVPAGIAAAAILGLALMMSLGSMWGAGTRNLWLGIPIPKEQIAAREIRVTPGDATVRRNQDIPIRASVSGFDPDAVEVHVRFGEGAQWERAPMKPAADGAFEFTVYALREPFSYYVTSRGTRSPEHRISVVEVPRVERMRLTYEYPSWTGLKPETDERSRDIRAVAGTKVNVEVQTSAPLDSPSLLVNGDSSPLSGEGVWTRGTLELKEDGQYRINARVGDELVPLTDEYQITLVEDQLPTIEVAKPGRDWQASSIEEVPVRVRATDDFRVQNVELHYSVNGGEWQVTPFKGRGKEVSDSTVLRLEELGEAQAAITGEDGKRLMPGDLVTYYAVAKDRKQSVQTDLFLIHVQPFERRFTQGQAGGMQGGGGGQDQQDVISQRQREILLATWNLQRTQDKAKGRDAERVSDNARMLSELQTTLAEQATTLVQRAQARGVDNADPKNKELIENLQQAVQAMQPAARHLGEKDFPNAIPSEQKALQHLLRAEALYTDIQLQFAQNGAGGSGGQAGRDLAEMFDLEMDVEKNQYETESRAANDESPQQLTDAIRKLRELARRQEQLAREQQSRQQQQRESDKWKQEQLRRETEDLRKRLAELSQQRNAQQQGSQGQGQGQGQQSANAANEALNQIERALENMEGASGGSQSGNGSSGGQQSSGGNNRSAEQASRDLRAALEKMEQGRRDGVAGSFDDLARRAQALLDQQRRTEEELRTAYRRPDGPGSGTPAERQRGLSWERAEALAEQKRALQSELDSLQRDMQASAQHHNEQAPKAAGNVGEAATSLAESGLSAGLARSAMELERGRGLQAAGRDPLITEAMEALQEQLNQAAGTAATEARQRRTAQNEATADDLLSELSALRRAWQLAQNDPRNAQREGGNLDPNGRGGPNGERDPNGLRQNNGERDPNGRGQPDSNDASDQRSAQSGQQPGQQSGQSGQQSGQSRGDSAGSESGGPNGESGGPDRGANAWGGGWGGPDRGYARHYIEGDRGRLNAWNPPLRANALRPVDPEEFRRQAEEIARRLRELGDRLPEGVLPNTDLTALRELANQLRRSSGDPMESAYAQMMGLVDQLELSALSAAEKGRATAATRAANPATDAPEYRETVAEYYRRLGDGQK